MYTIRDDLRKCLQNDVVPDWSAQKKNPPRINLVKGSLLLVARLTILLPLAILVFFSKNSSRRSSSLRQNLGEELSNVLIPLPSCKRPNRIHWLSNEHLHHKCKHRKRLAESADFKNKMVLKTLFILYRWKICIRNRGNDLACTICFAKKFFMICFSSHWHAFSAPNASWRHHMVLHGT